MKAALAAPRARILDVLQLTPVVINGVMPVVYEKIPAREGPQHGRAIEAAALMPAAGSRTSSPLTSQITTWPGSPGTCGGL